VGHDDQFDNWSISYWPISDPLIGGLIKVTHFSFLRKMPSHVALKPNFFFLSKKHLFLSFFLFFFFFFFRTSNSNQFVEPQKVMVTTEEQQVETRSLQDLWEEHANDWDLETRALLADALRPSTLQNYDSVLASRPLSPRPSIPPPLPGHFLARLYQQDQYHTRISNTTQCSLASTIADQVASEISASPNIMKKTLVDAGI